jgi:hypothetical protein
MAARTSVIAYVGEDEQYGPIFSRAIDAAKAAGAMLIYYDADAASRFASPLPTWWSSDEEDDDNQERLRPEHLEAAGRQWLADKVREARAAGLTAYGWLPSSRGADQLSEYATNHNAELVIVPSDLEHKGFGDWMKGTPSAEEVDEKVPVNVIVVDIDTGNIRSPQAAGSSG